MNNDKLNEIAEEWIEFLRSEPSAVRYAIRRAIDEAYKIRSGECYELRCEIKNLRRQLDEAKEERRRLRGIITDWQKQWSEFEPKLQQAEADTKRLASAIKWLLEFVERPEYFPGEGDSQWWDKKLNSIRTDEVMK